ncbi:16S rRNA (uracil(1498)-N(3))-methyltransferase [Arachidicoccus sp.]|uniref:16S rRNA (uracil(1498)-N(3))-methyltransferase n=1 Tax=Arachidicoccus sp. TaxID=1872624 RepID=UPI003D1FC423
MQLPLFYEPQIAKDLSTFNLSENSSKHCVQVLRMKIGDRLHITDGLGNLLTVRIISAHKKNCSVKMLDRKFFPSDRKNLCIAITPTKNSARMEWLLEKLTEIGVTKIILMQCEHSERLNIRYERLHHILISAMLQSQQLHLPQLSELTSFEQVISKENYAEKYIAHCADDAEKAILPTNKTEQSKIILIGPEGDFSPHEIALSKAHKYIPVSLGETRLRTETAGLVAAVLLLH